MVEDEPPDDTKLTAKQEIKPAPSGRNRAYLIVLAGNNVGEMFKVEERPMIIGRDPGADIQILDDEVSRRHAEVRFCDGTVVLEDLNSTNGTLANGLPVTRRVLQDGDKIQVGSASVLKFTFHDELDEDFQRQMYESALRDGLTKAFNKKYLLDRLDSELRFARRHTTPLSLIMFDIDHFKRINDTYGHLAGDHVLVVVAQHVQESIRNEDVFARYGGEEFVVICRAVLPHDAAILAERLRTRIGASPVTFERASIPVTVSVGVAGYPAIDAEQPAALIQAADEALYVAKRSGRNRVHVAGPTAAVGGSAAG